ncbi:MAG: O-antigen ligase family protein [Limnochordales bacterium]|nr:O-antigen ligase family protein [Limnochordales bacterium]
MFLRLSACEISWVFFLVFALSSALWSVYPSAVATLTSTLLLFFMYLVILRLPWDRKTVAKISRGIVFGGVVASAISIVMYFQGYSYLSSHRSTLVLGENRRADPNHFAASLVLPLVFLLGKQDGGLRRIVRAIFAAIVALAIVLSGSRGAVLASILAVAHLVLSKGLSSKRSIYVAGILILTLIVVTIAVPSELKDRFSVQGVLNSGGSGRLGLWRVAFAAFLERPLIGWGFGSFGRPAPGMVPWAGVLGTVPHSIYLQSLSELGIVGLLLLGSVLATHYARARKLGRNSEFYQAVAAAMVALIVVSATLGTLNYKYFWLIQMLAAARTQAQ